MILIRVILVTVGVLVAEDTLIAVSVFEMVGVLAEGCVIVVVGMHMCDSWEIFGQILVGRVANVMSTVRDWPKSRRQPYFWTSIDRTSQRKSHLYSLSR